jgi:hypothetical protein
VNDLQQLSYAIQNAYSDERKLPASLDAAMSRPGERAPPTHRIR